MWPEERYLWYLSHMTQFGLLCFGWVESVNQTWGDCEWRSTGAVEFSLKLNLRTCNDAGILCVSYNCSLYLSFGGKAHCNWALPLKVYLQLATWFDTLSRGSIMQAGSAHNAHLMISSEETSIRDKQHRVVLIPIDTSERLVKSGV